MKYQVWVWYHHKVRGTGRYWWTGEGWWSLQRDQASVLSPAEAKKICEDHDANMVEAGKEPA